MHWRIPLSRRLFLKGLVSATALLSTWNLRSGGYAQQDSTARRLKPRLGDIDENAIFDVCIIGSGFAGSIVGTSLVRHGLKTVILESGSVVDSNPRDPRFQQLEIFQNSGSIAYPVVATRFRGLGGTSWLWAGLCPRLQPLDFQRNSYTPPDADWPISYADLEPYYQRAEEALRVRGGEESEYHPPRQKGFPLPPDRDHSRFISFLDSVGIKVSAYPNSTSKGYVGGYGAYGPPLRMIDTHLPEFQSSSHSVLSTEATVTRLVPGPNRNIIGAEVTDLDRNVRIVRARVYVIACGALESPRLLLLSRSANFPHGIGNDHGLVGRYFMEHMGVFFETTVPQSNMGWRNFSLYNVKGNTYQFYREFKEKGLGGIVVGLRLEGIRIKDFRSLNSTRIRSALGNLWNRGIEIEVGFEMEPRAENRVFLDPEVKDYFGNPVTHLSLSHSKRDLKTIELGKQKAREIVDKLGASLVQEPYTIWGHHHMGTCRMGDNPRTSVVDRHLRVHDVSNLFVAGSAAFVTGGVSNPTLTLTALSLRLADHLRKEFQADSFVAQGLLRKSASRSAP